MRADELREYLRLRGIEFGEQPIQHATQFRLDGGEVISVFDTGRVAYQGQRTGVRDEIEDWATRRAAGAAAGAPAAVRGGPPATKVFIVYGRDTAARDSLELLLRRLGFDPIVLANLAAAGDTLIEKLERYLGEHAEVGFACVLLTPDDEGHLAGVPEEKRYRARQNVVLELGMVLARLGRPRVAILHKRSVELPSDINGLIYIPFDERVDELRAALFRELEAAGLGPRPEGL